VLAPAPWLLDAELVPLQSDVMTHDQFTSTSAGLTIFQVAEIQRGLGKCTCKGRMSAEARELQALRASVIK